MYTTLNYLLVPDDKKLTLLKLRRPNVLKKDGPEDINLGILLRAEETSLFVIARQ